MVALSIDTAANICAVAISDIASGEILASISDDIGRGHAEVLMEQIGQGMKHAGVDYRDLERVISTTGPGSFTGVRVGLSCARAIALALEIPAIGVSNLQACAAYTLELLPPQTAMPTVIAILDARREEVYFQQFKNGIGTGEARIVSLGELVDLYGSEISKESILCGNGANEFLRALRANGVDIPISTYNLNATAPIEFIAKLGINADVFETRPVPLYLRGPDAKVQQGFAVDRKHDPNIRP